VRGVPLDLFQPVYLGRDADPDELWNRSNEVYGAAGLVFAHQKGMAKREGTAEPEIFAVELPRTSWSDTHGTPIDRSNHRSLIRDSDGLGKDLPAFRSAHVTVVRPADLFANDAKLLKDCKALTDKPVYDPPDLELMERQILGESWRRHVAGEVSTHAAAYLRQMDDDPDKAWEVSHEWLTREFIGRYEAAVECCGPEVASATDADWDHLPEISYWIAKQLTKKSVDAHDHEDPKRQQKRIADWAANNRKHGKAMVEDHPVVLMMIDHAEGCDGSCVDDPEEYCSPPHPV
jgi:hypothetical protein